MKTVLNVWCQRTRNSKIQRYTNFVKTGLFLQKSCWSVVSRGEFFLNMEKWVCRENYLDHRISEYPFKTAKLQLCYTLFAFLEAVDQDPFLWFSQKVLIIAAICYNTSIPCVISFKKTYFYGLVQIISKLLPRESLNGV